ADIASFTAVAGGTVSISAANASVLGVTKIGAVTLTISGPGSLKIGASGISRTGGNPANIFNITANVVVGSAGETWNIVANTNTFSGTISGASFIKTGNGMLVLSGSNSFSGATVNS